MDKVKEQWYQDPHIWAMILADIISVLGIVTKYLPPDAGATIIAISHTLVGIDQMLNGMAQAKAQSAATPISAAPPVAAPVVPATQTKPISQ